MLFCVFLVSSSKWLKSLLYKKHILNIIPLHIHLLIQSLPHWKFRWLLYCLELVSNFHLLVYLLTCLPQTHLPFLYSVWKQTIEFLWLLYLNSQSYPTKHWMSNRHKGHVYIGSVGPWPMDKVGPQFGRPTMTQPGRQYDVTLRSGIWLITSSMTAYKGQFRKQILTT